MILFLADCFIRVTALLEYLNLTFITQSYAVTNTIIIDFFSVLFIAQILLTFEFDVIELGVVKGWFV